MRILLTSALVASTFLAACSGGGSSSSPFGWFGKSRSERAEEPSNPLIPGRSAFSRRPAPDYDGQLVAQVLELRAERVTGGAIIRVKGLSSTLGAYDVRLIPVETEAKATLAYSLEARYSQRSRPPAPATSRELVVAHFLTDDELAGIRTIRVSSAQNALSVRR